MADFFSQVSGFFEFIVDFFIGSINAIVDAIPLFGAGLNVLDSVSAFLPGIFGIGIGIFVATYIIKFLIKR